MPRIRTIKPEFPQSETVGSLSRDARLLFIQLWTLADDYGRARAHSRALASLLYPYDEDAGGLIGGWLDELEAKGCITLYEAEGSHYLEIKKWKKHQRVDKPSKWSFPEPSANPREPSRALAEPSLLDQGPRTKDQGPKEGTSNDVPAAAAAKPIEKEKPKPAKPKLTKKDKKKGAGEIPPSDPPAPRVKTARELANEAEFTDPISGRVARAEAARYFNQVCSDLAELNVPLPWLPMEVKENGKIELDHVRSRAIRDRLKQLGGVEGWKALLERAQDSDFLIGKSRRSSHDGWAPGVDFFLNPQTVTKIREGFYDSRRGNGSAKRSVLELGAELDAMMKEALDRDEQRRQQEIDLDPRAGADQPRALPKPDGGG